MVAPEDLWFIAQRVSGDAQVGRARCLVRVSTPLGAPHVACHGCALGERWLDLMGVARQACLVAAAELTAAIHFDIQQYGVLVFEDDAALDAYLFDADGFDYATRIVWPVLEARSDDPW